MAFQFHSDPRKRVKVSETGKPETVTKDLVVSMSYQLFVDNEMIDSSDENDPLQFIQGQGQIIPGLERELEGMKIGESKHVLVKAADGYGEYDPEQIVEMPKSDFPADFALEPDMEVTFEDEDGSEHTAFVEEVSLETVTFNFNHPLAGNDLLFDVTVTGLRPATPEELAHGHVHLDEE
jgi:FKBP-type peptidyl-prolyl cis-trans isomerase SlyD